MAEVTLDKTPQKVRDLFNRGFAAFERGNLDYAIDLLFACVEMAPGLLQARKFLRAAEIRRLKRKKHVPLIHIISTITGLPSYLTAMGMVKSEKTGKALALAERLLRKDPLNLKFVKLFTYAASKAGLSEAAIQTLEIARDHYPGDTSVMKLLGALYIETGRAKAARECFERLCEISPNDPKAIKSLKDAMALESMATDGWAEIAETGGTYRDMIKDAKEAVLLEQEAKAVKSEDDADALIADALAKIEAEPSNINHYRLLTRLYVQKKMFADAIAALEKAIEINPGDPELERAMGSTRIQQFDYQMSELKDAGDTAGAESKEAERNQFIYDDLQDRVKRYPNDLQLRYELGVILYDNGYLNEAIQQFQMSQRSAKHRVRSLFYLAMCFKMKKQYDMALAQLVQANAELPTMDAMKKDVCYELGEISGITGNREKAAEYYKQIYQVDIGYRDIAEKIEQVYKR